MVVNIIEIGNSLGIRIPKAILKQCDIHDAVTLEVKGRSILLKPEPSKPREGWEDAFKKMHDNKDDVLLMDDSLDLDVGEWKW